MSDLKLNLSWTLFHETDPSEEIMDILIEGEEIKCAYKTVSDIAAVTNKRLIIAEKQGFTGKEIEIYSIPYKSIAMYATESEHCSKNCVTKLEIWTCAGSISLKLEKGVDIRKLDKMIGEHIL